MTHKVKNKNGRSGIPVPAAKITTGNINNKKAAIHLNRECVINRTS